jgi:hypothetical protein
MRTLVSRAAHTKNDMGVTYKVRFRRSLYGCKHSFIYSLWFGKRSCLGQRHDLQNTTLTYLLYKYIYWKVIHVYFYENDFQNKSIDTIFTFLTQQFKSYSWFIFPMLTQILSKTTSFSKTERVTSNDISATSKIAYESTKVIKRVSVQNGVVPPLLGCWSIYVGPSVQVLGTYLLVAPNSILLLLINLVAAAL